MSTIQLRLDLRTMGVPHPRQRETKVSPLWRTWLMLRLCLPRGHRAMRCQILLRKEAAPLVGSLSDMASDGRSRP